MTNSNKPGQTLAAIAIEALRRGPPATVGYGAVSEEAFRRGWNSAMEHTWNVLAQHPDFQGELARASQGDAQSSGLRLPPVQVPIEIADNIEFVPVAAAAARTYSFSVRFLSLDRLGFQVGSFEASNTAYTREEALGQFLRCHPKIRVLDIFLPPRDTRPLELQVLLNGTARNMEVQEQELPTYLFVLKEASPLLETPSLGEDDRSLFGGITLDDALGRFMAANPRLCYDDILDHMEV